MDRIIFATLASVDPDNGESRPAPDAIAHFRRYIAETYGEDVASRYFSGRY